MQDMQSLDDNYTFVLIKLPKAKEIWRTSGFTIWNKMTSRPQYKTRLGFKGFSQRKGVESLWRYLPYCGFWFSS